MRKKIDALPEPSTDYQRLESESAWYDGKSATAQLWFKMSKVSVMVCAVGIPLVANYEPLVAAFAGALVAILEGFQHLFQWHEHWISYRSTCEALKHEKYTYLAKSGPYDKLTDETRLKVLAERTEALISTEHSKWIANQYSAARKPTEEPAANHAAR